MKKRLFLDPSLHVIENEDSLVLTTIHKHLKIPVHQAEIKEKFYQFMEYIDQGYDYEEIMKQKIYNKLLDQLIGHGILFIDDTSINFQRRIIKQGAILIKGDRKVNAFLKKMLESDSVEINPNCLKIFSDQDKEKDQKEMIYWINHNYLYITMDKSFKEKIREHRLNDLSAQYIAHSIIEFLNQDDPIDQSCIYRAELSKPTAKPKALFQKIDLDNLQSYREYLLFDEREGEYLIHEVSKDFFPFHTLCAENKTTSKLLYGIGRNEEEAFRNLILIIKLNQGDYTINTSIYDNLDEMSESEIIFFRKITNIYTGKDVEFINCPPDSICLTMGKLSLQVNSCKLNYPLALFLLSTYKTLLENGEGDAVKTIILDLQMNNQVREGDPIG
jgi:hypothetical protein